MSPERNHERRKYERFETELKIHFYVAYDVQTKVEFQIVGTKETPPKKYPAVSRNVSAEGICIIAEKELANGQVLYLEVFLPGENQAIPMLGEVCWCKLVVSKKSASDKIFEIGIKLKTVEGKSVPDSIYFDQTHRLHWSIVLESVFGNFKKLMQEKKLNQQEQRI